MINERKENLENFFQGMQTGDLVEEFKNGAVEIPVNKLEQCGYLSFDSYDKPNCWNKEITDCFCFYADNQKECKHAKFKENNLQTAKADNGKIEMAYVPRNLKRAVEEIKKLDTFDRNILLLLMCNGLDC